MAIQLEWIWIEQFWSRWSGRQWLEIHSSLYYESPFEWIYFYEKWCSKYHSLRFRKQMLCDSYHVDYASTKSNQRKLATEIFVRRIHPKRRSVVKKLKNPKRKSSLKTTTLCWPPVNNGTLSTDSFLVFATRELRRAKVKLKIFLLNENVRISFLVTGKTEIALWIPPCRLYVHYQWNYVFVNISLREAWS